MDRRLTASPVDVSAPERAIVRANILRRFPELVSELGGDASGLFEAAAITPDNLDISGSPEDCRRAINLLEHAATRLHRPDFGLRLAALQQRANIFGSMDVLLRNASTLGDALAYVHTHPHIHSLTVAMRMERRDDGDVFIGTDILLGDLSNKAQAIEHAMLVTHLNAVRSTGGRARVRSVFFRHPPVSEPGVYRRYFGCEVLFNQHEDGVLFSEDDLRAPIVDADRKTYQAATVRMSAARPEGGPPVHVQVRAVILRLFGTEECGATRAAAELRFHPRELYRRLKAEGTSFLAIKDGVRRDIALYLLRETDLSLTQIAQKLGYAEHSVLTRSCVRWFGAAPTQVRRDASRRL